MKIKSAKSFRYWYKTKVKEIDRNDKNHNENFVGTYHKEKGNKTIKGFFEMYHGHKPDIAGYLPSILKIAEDGQAIYEFLQNAVDCGSTHFYIFYNEKYFLAINNGSPFDIDGLESILNIAQTTKKDPDKIGRFGIGFKLAHRLVGKNEGTDELVRQYKGPILFSWAKLEDLESLLNNERIEPITPQKGVNNGFFDAPYLLKLLLTNFPSDPNETVKDINYKDKVLFPKEELNELVGFLNENFKNHSDSLNKNVLNQGSLFFIKLGEDKKKLLDKDYSELVNGIQYSMNTLKRLQKVYINNDDIGKIPLQLEEGIIKKGSDEFEKISPEYKEFDIKFAVGFNTIKFGNDKSYEQIKLLKAKPSFYKYFPMGDEINGFGFIVHCDSFSNESNRRKLHEDDVNRNLFPVLAQHITHQLTEYKTKDRSKFLNLYASLLLSDIPDRQNNKWLRPIFYDVLLNSLQKNVPTKNGFLDNAQNVKINKLKTSLNLSDFGLGHINWFEWDNEADRLLIDEATNTEKLGIEEWGIRDIIENSNLENINNWIATCDKKIYEEFLAELEKCIYLRKKTKEKICQIKFFKFSNDKFYSLNEIVKRQITQNRVTFNYGYPNVFFKTPKTEIIANELGKLGIFLSEINVFEYPNIFSSVEKMPDEKLMYTFIAEKCKTNTLSAQEKRNVFLNLISETTKFDNVGDETIKKLELFCDSQNIVKPLSELVSSLPSIPKWLNSYKIKTEENLDFTQLNSYLIQANELFEKIVLPNIEVIKDELTEAKQIKELVTFFKENHRSFFNEFIIQKSTSRFAIIDKSDKYQIIPSKDERKTFISFIKSNLSDNFIVLPYDFSDFNDQDGILKGEKLHSRILELVDVDEHKETLIDIVHYNEPKRKLLREISKFSFNSETEYTKEDYEYKILDLACNELKENDFQTFRNKVIIETGVRSFNLSKIPPIVDKIKIATKEFSLSKILPSTYENNNLISDLITKFTKQGIPIEKLKALFGVNEEIDIDDIFEKFTEQTETLQNPEQFFFLIYYHKHIINIDLSKLGFDFTCAVFPSEFALETEKLPEYIQEWIKQDEVKISNLESIGIYTENSTLVSLRKFFLTENDFNLNTIAQDEKLSDGKMLFNTFEIIKEKEIELKSENEFAVFKEMFRVINLSRAKGQELIIQEEYNFALMAEHSTEWKSIGEFSIYLFNGKLPKIVKLNEIPDYVFYRYKDTDYAVNANILYINENEEKTKTLQKVALDEKNDFTSEDSKDIELSEVKAELEKYKKEGQPKEDNPNSTFLEDINDFISELEGTEWSSFVPELKNIVELSVSQPKEKQKLFNLIAKIKLAKELNIHFESANKDYNHLENGNEKYFVHSARGAFAYIHPNEILRMKEEGYKMALDFSTKSRIKIYDTAQEILQLNTNHILAYQYEKTMDELFTFCEANRDANKHLLIIDKNNSGEKSRELLKLLNIEDDYQ
jgi:hypothetical protein